MQASPALSSHLMHSWASGLAVTFISSYFVPLMQAKQRGICLRSSLSFGILIGRLLCRWFLQIRYHLTVLHWSRISSHEQRWVSVSLLVRCFCSPLPLLCCPYGNTSQGIHSSWLAIVETSCYTTVLPPWRTILLLSLELLEYPGWSFSCAFCSLSWLSRGVEHWPLVLGLLRTSLSPIARSSSFGQTSFTALGFEFQRLDQLSFTKRIIYPFQNFRIFQQFINLDYLFAI